MNILFEDGWLLHRDNHNWMLTSPPPEGLSEKGNPLKGVTTYHKDIPAVRNKLMNEKAKGAESLKEMAQIFNDVARVFDQPLPRTRPRL